MYTSKITCCKDCEERYIGCHSKCEKYITEKQMLEKSKELYYKSLPPKIGEGDLYAVTPTIINMDCPNPILLKKKG